MRKITVVLLVTTALLFGQNIPTEGLVGQWKMDEGEGALAGDSSGYGADGELIDVVDWVDGYIGKALDFDGESGYVDCGLGEGQFDVEDGLTLSIWVNQWEMGNGEHNPWLGKGDHAYAIKHWSGGLYEFFVYDTDWHSCHAELDSSHLYTWHHFAGTYDGFEMKMYVDGVPADTVELESFIQVTDNTLTMGWNSDPSATGRFFMGQLDEAMIYNVALTDEQILALYNVKSAVMHERSVANKFNLQQNYPNPFNPVTTISYTIPATLPVSLKVYDTLGKEVQTIVDDQQTIGTHTAVFDASALSSGIYFYKLQAGDQLTEIKKMTLIK